MIRVAVVGVGGMGACHARHVHDLGGAEVAWVADPDESAGRSLAEEVGASWTADGDAAIADCDALVIASPDRFHAHYVQAGLDAGVPILCEKPMTVELSDAEAILAREVELGRRLVQLGFMRVYDERHTQVAAAIGSLGLVNHVRCVHRNTNVTARPVAQLLVESIIHDIHTIRWLSGSEINRVATSTVHRDRGLHFVVLTCELANGGVATVEFDDAATGYEVSVEVSAERGNVVASEPLRARVRDQGAVAETIGDDWFTPFLDTYRIETRAWLDSIVAGSPTGPTAWDGYAAQAVVAAASVAAETGGFEPVEIQDQPALYKEGPT